MTSFPEKNFFGIVFVPLVKGAPRCRAGGHPRGPVVWEGFLEEVGPELDLEEWAGLRERVISSTGNRMSTEERWESKFRKLTSPSRLPKKKDKKIHLSERSCELRSCHGPFPVIKFSFHFK